MHLRRTLPRQTVDNNIQKRQEARRKLIFESLETRRLLAAIDHWVQMGPGGGGALFSPSINPHNHAELFVPSDMSQVFHSTDRGASWDTLDFREIQGNWATNIQFTSDAQVAYAIDYSLIDFVDAATPVKSLDGGGTWQHLGSDPTGGEAFTLQVDYDNPDRVMVSSWRRLYTSHDGGGSFRQTFVTDDSNSGLHIGGALFDGDDVYIGTNQGLLVSTDGGLTFEAEVLSGIPADERIVSFAGSTEAGLTRMYAVTMFRGDVFAGVRGLDHTGYRGVYSRDLGQQNWLPHMAGIDSAANPFFITATAGDVDTVYVAGGSDQGTPTVFRSINGGDDWTNIFLTQENRNVATGWSGDGGVRGWSYGENALGFTIAHNDPSQLLITDFGFAHHSDDGGETWRALNVDPADRNPAGSSSASDRSYRSSGLDNTSIWGVTWVDQTNLIGLYSDIRGALSNDSGQSWSFDYSGHDQNSMYRAIVSDDGVVYAATSTIHDLYQSTHLLDSRIDRGGGKALFSHDGGSTWQTLHDFGHVVSWVELDPTNPNRLYASVVHSTQGGIYVSDNIQDGQDSSWRKLPDPARTEGHPFNLRVLDDGTLVATFSGRRANSPTAFTPSSGVFVSEDGGQTWLDRSDTGMHYWTRDIEIDPHDELQNSWYVSVFSGWGGPPNDLGGLYKTTDRGLTWNRIFETHRVASATAHPSDPAEMYITTEGAGLWYTDSLDQPTPSFTPVESYPFRNPMRVAYNPFNTNEVWVTSFGNGLFVGRTAPDRFSVTSLQTDASGFQVEFSGAIDSSELNLFDTENADRGAADVVVSGAASGPVSGSLVVSGTSATFIKTGGPLLADTYSVTLRSAENGFKDTAGALLDGNGDGTGGDDFVTEFTVAGAPPDARTIHVPDFVRGPGQSVNLPADTANGIPVSISDGANIRTVDLQVGYDPALLEITGATAPAGGTVVLDTTTPGLAVLAYSRTVALSPGESTIIQLETSVPITNAGEIYGRQQVLDVHSIVLSDGSNNQFPAVADRSLHLASYLADVSGNRRINASDAAQIARYAALIDGGFVSSLSTDPAIIGDVSGNGRVNAADASLVAQFAALLEVPQIPPIPGDVVFSAGWWGGLLPRRASLSTRLPGLDGVAGRSEPLPRWPTTGDRLAVDLVFAERDRRFSSNRETRELSLETMSLETTNSETMPDGLFESAGRSRQTAPQIVLSFEKAIEKPWKGATP